MLAFQSTEIKLSLIICPKIFVKRLSFRIGWIPRNFWNSRILGPGQNRWHLHKELLMPIILSEKNFSENHKLCPKIDIFWKKDEFEAGLERVGGRDYAHEKGHCLLYQKNFMSTRRKPSLYTKNAKKWLSIWQISFVSPFSLHWNNIFKNGLLNFTLPRFAYLGKL